MKRRSQVRVDYATPDEEAEDDDFVDGRLNREKNNNNNVRSRMKERKSADLPRTTKEEDSGRDEDDVDEYDHSNCDDVDIDSCDGDERAMASVKEKFPLRPKISVVSKGPKKLVLKKKFAKSNGGDDDADDRGEGETVTLIRGKKDRKFVLFKSENFNFAINHRRNTDLIHHFCRLQTDGPSTLPSSMLVKPLLNSIRTLRVNHSLGVFDRRVTAIEWHPTLSNKVAVGSKGGEIMLLDIAKQDPTEDAAFIPGVGAGGSIGAMRFCPSAPEWVLTSCLNSTVEVKNLLNPSKTKVLWDTGDWNKWFVSCDLNESLYAAGQSTGILQLFDRKSLDVFVDQKIHKGKITHVEFSKHHEYLLATASVGHEVKIWDVRNMKTVKNEPNCLHTLPHDAGVNVASFSRFNGQRLLTSDQYGQIRVYALPGFYLERSILHPHRQFQHLTPIKAAWHPLQDLIVIGRWPDPDFVGYSPNEKRTIDVFDANTGSLSLQLFDASLGGIISLNQFSNDGQFLCSGMSRNVLLWRPSRDWNDEAMEGQMDGILCGDLLGGDDGKTAKGNKRRPPKGKQTKDKKNAGDVKVKVQTATATKAKGKTKKGGKKSKDEDD